MWQNKGGLQQGFIVDITIHGFVVDFTILPLSADLEDEELSALDELF